MPNRAAWILLYVLVLSLAASAFAQDSSGDSTRLNAAAWSGSVYSHEAGGYLCWLGDRDGSLRLEAIEAGQIPGTGTSGIDADPLEMLDPLMTRTGNGWTLILGPDDTGTLNAWGREWRTVPRGLAQVVRLLTVALQDQSRRPEYDFAASAGPPEGWTDIPRPSFAGSGFLAGWGEATWRYQLSSLDPDAEKITSETSFRSRLTARGRGTGGTGEIVSLKWAPTAGGTENTLVVSSSRRPGTLRVGPIRGMAVKSPEPEVFLPLWPLSQFIESR